MNHKSRLVNTLMRQPVDSTPIWFMRQAGRYLPEYRALRAKIGSFLGMCQNPDVATEITLQPLARFDLDAAIIFSDILTIPDAFGLGLSFQPDMGPVFARPIETRACVDKIPAIDPNNDLQYVMQTVRQVKRELEPSKALIGFCGSPWTVATYMVEGQGSKQFTRIKKMLYGAPDVLHALLTKLADTSAAYLIAQIEAGCDVVMIFDTWGGVLTPQAYQQFSLAYMQKMVQQLKAHPKARMTPVILFTKGGGFWLEAMAQTGCDALGLDWTVDIKAAKARVGDKVVLQGNLDPAILYAPDNVITEAVANILTAFGTGGGHIFNLGHGMHPDIDPGKVAVLVEAIRAFSPKFHQKELSYVG